jgi:hypothetical protein
MDNPKGSLLEQGIRRLNTMRRALVKGQATLPAKSLALLHREIRHQERLNKVIVDRGL